ncbi:MAG: hypothetical protein KBA81_06735 [Rhabdochlamydiaceae bacterium]|nr:hypothetical protein [Rhabdochlamydiaceae bacterium]
MVLSTHRKPTPPGQILLEEFLIPLNISQTEFVEHLGGHGHSQNSMLLLMVSF